MLLTEPLSFGSVAYVSMTLQLDSVVISEDPQAKSNDGDTVIGFFSQILT